MKELVNSIKCLSDPNRLKILRLLQERDMCVCELMEVMQCPQARISQHLLRLRNEGLVDDLREGQYVIYSLNRKVFRDRMDSLNKFFFGDFKKNIQMKKEVKKLSSMEERGLLKQKLLPEKDNRKKK